MADRRSRYYEGKGLPVQLSADLSGLPPRKQTFNPDDWNTCQITCLGPRIKVVLNGEVVQDFNLDEQTAKLQKDKGTDLAEPLKDRPARAASASRSFAATAATRRSAT